MTPQVPEAAQPPPPAQPPQPAEVTPGGERPGRVTIRQIAELAGVSIATVSRVLNGRADVSDETRHTVQEVARSHGYGTRRAPREPARSTGLIGVTMPFAYPAYFASILSGAAEALYERDLRAVLCPTRHDHEREVSLLDRLMHGATDGALLVQPEESSAELRQLTSHGYRFVVVDPLYGLDVGIPLVSAAHAAGANQATRHLIDLGHRRIGVITGPTGRIASQRRLQGYHAALAAAGVMPDPDLEVAAEFVIGGGVSGAGRLLALPEPPNAIFAFNDNLAIGAARAARARGLSLPADLSIVGFDDTSDASIVFPPLTTVRQPLAELGRMAVTLLAQQLAGQPFEPLPPTAQPPTARPPTAQPPTARPPMARPPTPLRPADGAWPRATGCSSGRPTRARSSRVSACSSTATPRTPRCWPGWKPPRRQCG